MNKTLFKTQAHHYCHYTFIADVFPLLYVFAASGSVGTMIFFLVSTVRISQKAIRSDVIICPIALGKAQNKDDPLPEIFAYQFQRSCCQLHTYVSQEDTFHPTHSEVMLGNSGAARLLNSSDTVELQRILNRPYCVAAGGKNKDFQLRFLTTR